MPVSTIGDNNVAKRVEAEIHRRGADVRGASFRILLFSALALSTIILLILLVQVVTDGWPVIADRFGEFMGGTLRSRSTDDKLGISQGLVGSFWIAVMVAVLAFPIGIAAAVYLEEYAPRNRLTSIIDIAIRNLAGVPSVVYGLLGLFLFVTPRDGQSALFAGGVTLAILVLPIVVITAAEAVRAVPSSLREGAYGVGATKWDTIRTQVLPFAAPGILTGTLLSLARAIGEAAPLILVGAITGRLAPRDGSFFGLDQFADRFTAMPIVITEFASKPGDDWVPVTAAAIVVLLLVVLSFNAAAVLLRNRFESKRAGH